MNVGKGMRARCVRAGLLAAATALGLLVSACGGGGGGTTSPPADDHSLPTIISDVYPTGTRLDASTRDFLVFHDGDRAVYTRTAGGVFTGTVTRTVSGPDSGGNLSVTESDGTTTEGIAYRLDASGLLEFDPTGAQGVLPVLSAAYPSYYAYMTPFYPVGSTISHVRQNSLQGDLDGDGKTEYFRAELTQLFVGFETLTVLSQSTEVAHFTTTFRFTVVASSTGQSTTASAIEDTYLAKGLGLVRIDRSTLGPDGLPVEPPYRLDLQSATIDGVAHLDLTSSVEVPLNHKWLVYDAAHAAYYASVPTSDATHGNRIAKIDAAGAVTYSAPIASAPGPMAVSDDGSTLYVGLDDTGEVVRLALPGMTEVSRVALPVDPFFGQLFAEEIAVAPGSSDTYAVSMFRQNTSPRHGGVALVRGNVLQPQRTQSHTGSNRIGFDATGSWLYGYNNETTEFGLRRIEVLADGLIERTVTPAGGGFGADLRVADGLAIVSNQVFRADASLALLGSVANAANCVKLPGAGKIVCHSSADRTQLVVVDSTGFAPLAVPTYSSSGSDSPWRLVPGPSGQVAVSEDGRVTLYSNASLR